MAGVVAVALVADAVVGSWCLLGALRWALAAWTAWTAAAVVGVLEVRLAVVSVEWLAEVRLGVPFFLLPILRASHQGAGSSDQIRSAHPQGICLSRHKSARRRRMRRYLRIMTQPSGWDPWQVRDGSVAA